MRITLLETGIVSVAAVSVAVLALTVAVWRRRPVASSADRAASSADQFDKEELGTLSRLGAGVLGLAGLASGAVAVFVSHVEAGPVALLVAGLLCIIIALGGRIPARIKAGDYELEMYRRRVQTALEEGLESASPEAKEDVAAVVDRVAEVDPRAAAPARSAYEFELQVMGMVERLGFRAEMTPHAGGLTGKDRGFDFAVTSSHSQDGHDRQRVILMEVKAYTRRVASEHVRSLLGATMYYAQTHPELEVAAILVARNGFTTGAVASIRPQTALYLATVTGPSDTHELRMALDLANSGPPLSAL